MKQVISGQAIEVPDNVAIEIKARQVRVKGDRGMLLTVLDDVQPALSHLDQRLSLTRTAGAQSVSLQAH